MVRKGVFRKTSDEAVRAGTGKGWKRWFQILDAWSVKKHGHALTARHLREKYGLDAWWSQAVSIRYEWERGLRKQGASDKARSAGSAAILGD